MYNSVTRAANEALLGYWNQKVAVDMDEVEEATDIISFINENPVLTPGHIIRKYIEEGGLGDTYSNIEWNKTTIRHIVNVLGFDKDAQKWFSDEACMTRDSAYHLAFRLKMNTEWLLQLLNAVDGGLVNYHDCSEIVKYFFIRIGNYNEKEADKMIEKVKVNANSTQIETPEKLYAQGYTNFATDVLEKLANSTLPESEKEEELCRFLIENKENLHGNSLSQVGRLTRLMQHIALVYPTYMRVLWASMSTEDAPTKGRRNEEKSEWEEIKFDKNGLPKIGSLIYAMMGMDYKLVREQEKNEIFQTITSYHKHLYTNLRKELFSEKESGMSKAVSRNDVLFLTLQFILGYDERDDRVDITTDLRKDIHWYASEELSKNAPEKAFIFRKEVRDEIDSVMNTIMDRLDDYRDFPSNYSEPAKKYQFYVELFNAILSKFGFANMYILNPFDRFVIMTLLSDFPVGVWSELVYPGVELIPNKEEDMES
jgi:hypothetical protein